MKKILTLSLAVIMMFALASCGNKKEEKNIVKIGALNFNITEASGQHDVEKHPDKIKAVELKNEDYQNLSAALMDLKGGKITALGCEKSTADYIISRNNDLEYSEFTKNKNFSMMTTEDNKEVYDILNNAIVEMKADGTLDKLIETDLKAYIDNDPQPKELPVFDGAKTIVVGVTGDLPPMDFVALNGKAAGFNIALLSEIASRQKINFELVQIESGARPIALTSGKVDAVFWTTSITCSECDETWDENIDNILATESYYSDVATTVKVKKDK